MKGIVFTEFLDMVEENFGIEIVDYIINESKLQSEGIYTSVGTYDFVEMQSLLVNLSKKVEIPLDDLIYSYGLYFFRVLTTLHPAIFALYKDPIELVSSIENHIHVQVRKLYPGAELPTFKVEKKTEDHLEILYFSDRAMYMFAKALMEKTFEHYDRDSEIKMEKLAEDGTQVRFLITKKHGAYQKN
ncbi:heme NO-binding domain-containing protein [Zunongwangia endophytica]|uniref:Heme NO-binding domain-containing protein n=1 Tax=Zunongwangia endophytica TaxID=1808945 RepID=A0ABV8HCD1_9FLAO|nr:heme NO-binding domain-containing protein [Zunongwangia endophytica]MDN3596627.1 heme NO-binding domain-containing protein [Zunongwangia endophytica]